jgi:hypothetical protein
MTLLFLHIPHTCGRLIHSILDFNKIDFHRIHNDKDYTTKSFDSVYTILRDPLERCIAEYYHYSSRYKQMHDIQLQVNNLNLTKESYDSIEQYYQNENRCNLACKYLLQKDLDSKITDDDYNRILLLDFHYDLYDSDLNPTVLSELVNIDMKLCMKDRKYGHYKKISKEMPDFDEHFIASQNTYDIKLFNHLKNENKQLNKRLYKVC